MCASIHHHLPTVKPTAQPPLLRLQDCQIELEEYQESSRELEAELETQLIASEKRNAELKNQNLRLQSENENLKLKLSNLTGQTGEQIGELQRQLNETQISNAKLTRCIRELEQSNDDLERAKRALHASLDDFEKKLNHQIEKNVLLENELGEKEQLEEIIQRLKDEARDLKQELVVQQQTSTSALASYDVVADDEVQQQERKKSSEQIKSCLRPNSLYYGGTEKNGSSNHSAAPGKLLVNQLSNADQLAGAGQTSSRTGSDLPNCSLLSPSTRISVLNIVSDLLRKVGALESRLNQTSCKGNSQLNAVSSPIKNGHLNCQNGNFN